MGLQKNMNGANLPVFFHRSMGLILQVSLYFLADTKILSTFNVSAHIYTKQHYQLKNSILILYVYPSTSSCQFLFL